MDGKCRLELKTCYPLKELKRKGIAIQMIKKFLLQRQRRDDCLGEIGLEDEINLKDFQPED